MARNARAGRITMIAMQMRELDEITRLRAMEK